MKFSSLLPKAENYYSLDWRESQTHKGVRFAIRRVSLEQRLELTRQVRELTLRYEFLKAGDAVDQLDAALADLLVKKLYLEWGVVAHQGLLIDGEMATVQTLVEKGPEDLADEAIAALQTAIGLTDEERKN
jgi:hypothetical protein